jgi:hypothetical protein
VNPTRYVYVGVDPGFTGGIASIETIEGETLVSVVDMPVRLGTGRPRINRPAVVAVFKELIGPGTRLITAVEAVGAMGGKDRKEGTSSMFRFGQGQGEVLGILAGLGAVIFEVPPPVWKAKAGLIGADDREVCKRCVDLGLCPRSTVFGPRGGPLHGRADALLLARHAQQIGDPHTEELRLCQRYYQTKGRN